MIIAKFEDRFEHLRERDVESAIVNYRSSARLLAGLNNEAGNEWLISGRNY